MELYDLVREYFDEGYDRLSNHFEDIKAMEVLLEKENKLYNTAYDNPQVLVGIEFVVNTHSWQVTEAHANGRYKVEKLVEGSDGQYYVKNLDTNEMYLSDIESLSYLISHEGHQDYRFVYVGWCGDYRFLG